MYNKFYAVAEHSILTNHSMNFDKIDIWAMSYQYYDIKITEAVAIWKHENIFNKDAGFEISNTCTPVISKLKP